MLLLHSTLFANVTGPPRNDLLTIRRYRLHCEKIMAEIASMKNSSYAALFNSENFADFVHSFK